MKAACDVVTVGGMVIESAVIKESATTMQVPGDTAPDLDVHPGGYQFLASGEDGATILRENHSVRRSLGADVVLRGPEALHGDIRLADAATMRRATLAGLGVGLISTIDAVEDLKLGKLVAPFGIDVMLSMPEDQVPGFYLILPKAHRRIKTISAFCAWIEAEDWQRPVD